jgi:hypothetical protein
VTVRTNSIVALLVILSAGSVSADEIYTPTKLGLPQTVRPNPASATTWSVVEAQVTRSRPGPNGQQQQFTMWATRGRIASTMLPATGTGVFFEVLLTKRAQTQLERDMADPQGFIFKFHKPALPIAQSQLKTVIHHFDGFQDLRWMLGNDDLRLAEAAMGTPALINTLMPNARRPRSLIQRVTQEAGRQPPNAGSLGMMSIFGHGKSPTHPFVVARMGLGGQVNSLGSTAYRDGWLNLLVRRGPPPWTAAQGQPALTWNQLVAQKITAGDYYNAITLLPYRGGRSIPAATTPPAPQAGPGAVQAPQRVRRRGGYLRVDPNQPVLRPGAAPSIRKDLLGVEIKPRVHDILLACARDQRYGGVFLGLNSQGSGIFKFLGVATLRRMTELAVIQAPAGANQTLRNRMERAQQVGLLTREALIETLESAQLGLSSPFDSPAAVRPGMGFGAGTYLPVDPSEVAMVALQVVQSNPSWAQATSPKEARRLIRALVGLARLAAPLQAGQQADPRASDRHRIPEGVPAAAIRVPLRRTVFDTLASATHSGLLLQAGVDLDQATVAELVRQGLSSDQASELVARRGSYLRTGGPGASGGTIASVEHLKRAGFDERSARRIHARATASPYRRPLVEMVGEFDRRDRDLLLKAMTQAGSGPRGLFEDVVGRLFSVLLDNRGWTVPDSEVTEIKSDALAALGLISKLNGADELVFSRLDRLFAAKQEGKATSDEVALLSFFSTISGQPAGNAATTFAPERVQRRRFAAELNSNYRAYTQGFTDRLAEERGNLPAATALNYRERLEALERRSDRATQVQEALKAGELSTPPTQ